jgi:hypothetical protein
MKQTENNEIDLLLRSLARRQGERAVAPEGDSAHLDADELNSFAEQALPAAARARYTSHLAECADCRKIATELTFASGTHVAEQLESQKTSAGFWQRLADVFSPGVLRFAVPALALLAFIGIGLIALRQQTEPQFVAQNQPTATPRDATIEATQTASPAESERASAATENRRSSDARPNAVQDQKTQAKTVDQSPSKESPVDSVGFIADKDTSAGKAAGAVAQPSYAPEPASVPPPSPKTTQAESRNEVNARRKDEGEKKEELAREQEGARAGTDDNQNQADVARPQISVVPGQSKSKLGTLQAKRAGVAGAKANEDEADIRTVSGRRFRRQGSVWIDTAYQASTATTNVARDSEQFRALLADEPGIRSIVTQLSGEVIVVWKGRAYRIR